MTNCQAAKLRPGMTIRRKVPYADRAGPTSGPTTGDETFTVERIERPTDGDVKVYAGGQSFRPWEIERVRYPDERTP
ncbi:MAG: hypothetical protein M3176_05875 [Chloroflexota bacterium]|nr:hypothetical protein [Chloroflexota bacterium]